MSGRTASSVCYGSFPALLDGPRAFAALCPDTAVIRETGARAFGAARIQVQP